ncbi:glycoside hydrolase family 61 protein [Alternaria burnsii]|uniref:AA9 family lytic polysaccharide monooxygenase n=1 Tax=Alternaria burnsii TaxID=1187904 RepID=A0A8H7ASR5_9PLEO|nr:glycoside hydrolase family 61 protein [Alternaria burnsii]KAF7670891.1 glycoside hydrolase family 61 protein [Alternaria burnsii]
MWNLFASIAVFLAHHVSAHGGALNYTVGKTWYPGYDPYGDEAMQDAASWMPQRKWISNNPIFETTNSSLSCNTPGTPARAYIPIRAGENITAAYAYWVHTVGPMIAWMAYCDNADNDCTTFSSETADWFKIGEKGLLNGSIETGEWFQKAFSMWDGSPSLWSERVPVGLQAGRYLVRHEIISLHSANKPQFYPECAHLEVSNDGKGVIPSKEYMVKIPGVWNMDQPEINIDIYSPEISTKTVYIIPGPPIWSVET